MSGGEKSRSSFEAALEAKLAKGLAGQKREHQRVAAATAAAQAMRVRAEQTLPARQEVAEAAAATMRADARKAAEIMKAFGYPHPVPVDLKKGSQIVDPSQRADGSEYIQRRPFRKPATVFSHRSDVVDVWRITTKNQSLYNEGGGDSAGHTSYWQIGLALTTGGEIVRYLRSWNGSDNEADQLSEGLRYGAVVDYDCGGSATVNELAPLEGAREDGTYNPAIIERWRELLLAIR